MYTYSDCRARQSSRLLAQSYHRDPDPRILSILFHRHRKAVFHLCRTYLKHRMEAEDAMMEVFEHLPAYLERYRIRYFYSWLIRFTRNYCLKMLARRRQAWIGGESASIEEEISLEGRLQRERRIEQLYRGLEQLKRQQRDCLLGFYFEELSYREIALELQLSSKAVKSHIQNGKRNLRKFMLQY